MTPDQDLNIARDLGALTADMRTAKHDITNISAKIDGLSHQITQITNTHSKGLGFIAGATAVIGGVSALLIMLAKMAFGGN